ncbi:MAG: valine--pyruvate transaminase [Gammaproteobacteria bacterium]|nr:valine--pyruvate transaminase [Gammaproteobacteria bacterium]
MKFSAFGERFTRSTGALQLMDDLGAALDSEEPVLMLGGGNPARIPQVEQFFREELESVVADDRELGRLAFNYSPSGGDRRFRRELASMFKNRFGWPITADNIALTSGSQNAFFMLFNLFGGQMADGSRRQILLPLAPEYIGYNDVGIGEKLFTANRPRIELLDDNLFKYFVDLDNLEVGPEIGALCVSRPTNPTGNVLTDEEIDALSDLARRNDVPLIVDNAYGAPFPNIIDRKVTTAWNENTVLCLSLSKLGIPAVRTGIVVASEEIVAGISAMNATLHLAVSSVGPVWLHRAVRSGRLIDISNSVIRPYYRDSAERALGWVREYFQGVDYHVHRPEGAFFLWLWFPDLPISSNELYERLKQKGVLVVSGHHFFPGLDEEWQHKLECIRISHAQKPDIVREGIAVIAQEVREAYGL